MRTFAYYSNMRPSSYVWRSDPEIVLQRAFYARLGIDPKIQHGMDGLDKGNLYENKLHITDLNEVLFQAIKYASRLRIRGQKLPANIILNDLSAEKVWVYKAKDLLPHIEKIYFGAASKNNRGYECGAVAVEEISLWKEPRAGTASDGRE
jgi:hypothetical protein